jgi:hypothetical protein
LPLFIAATSASVPRLSPLRASAYAMSSFAMSLDSVAIADARKSSAA